MPRIILIETSTALCSAALTEGESIVEYRESSEPKAHASLTAPFIKEMLNSQGIGIKDCDAVCVSMGPGSYTGLRVGVSTAKGLCFGGKLPLLAISTPEVLLWQALSEGLVPKDCRYIVPMIDARRMEAYTAVFDTDARQIRETKPEIFDENSFGDLKVNGNLLCIGDAAEKCSGVVGHDGVFYHQCYPKASAMLTPALREYKEKRFKDIAYFEPFYLKEFTATVSKKSILGGKPRL